MHSLSFPLHYLNERVVVVLTFLGYAFETFTTILRTFHITKDTFFKSGEQAFLHDFLEKSYRVVYHQLGTLTADTAFTELHLLTDAVHVVEDVFGILN